MWALSLGATPRWTRLSPTGAGPGPRSDCGAVFDDIRQRMLVWGGYQIADDAIHSESGVWALSLSGEPTWSRVAETGRQPYPASSGSVVFDPARDRMVTYGGSQTFGEYLPDFRALEFAGTAAPRGAWLVAAQAAPDGVRLLWQTDALAPTTVGIEQRVETAPEGGAFLRPRSARAIGSGFVRRSPTRRHRGVDRPRRRPGRRCTATARARPASQRGRRRCRSRARRSFVIDGVAPLPTTGALALSFRSTRGRADRLSLYDVRGRRVDERDLGSLPEGPQSVNWEVPPARSGVYFLRLVQGANAATRKIVVAR